MGAKKKVVIGAIIGIIALAVIVLVAFNLGKNQNPVVNKANTVKTEKKEKPKKEDTKKEQEEQKLLETPVYSTQSGRAENVAYLLRSDKIFLNVFSNDTTYVGYQDYNDEETQYYTDNSEPAKYMIDDTLGLDPKNYDVLNAYTMAEPLTGHNYLFLESKKDNDILITLHLFDNTNTQVTDKNRLDNVLLTLKAINGEDAIKSKKYVNMLNPEETTDKFYLNFAINPLFTDNPNGGFLHSNVFVNMFFDGEDIASYAYKNEMTITDMHYTKAYIMILMYNRLFYI